MREDHEEDSGQYRADEQGTETTDLVAEEHHGARVPGKRHGRSVGAAGLARSSAVQPPRPAPAPRQPQPEPARPQRNPECRQRVARSGQALISVARGRKNDLEPRSRLVVGARSLGCERHRMPTFMGIAAICRCRGESKGCISPRRVICRNPYAMRPLYVLRLGTAWGCVRLRGEPAARAARQPRARRAAAAARATAQSRIWTSHCVMPGGDECGRDIAMHRARSASPLPPRSGPRPAGCQPCPACRRVTDSSGMASATTQSALLSQEI